MVVKWLHREDREPPGGNAGNMQCVYLYVTSFLQLDPRMFIIPQSDVYTSVLRVLQMEKPFRERDANGRGGDRRILVI